MKQKYALLIYFLFLSVTAFSQDESVNEQILLGEIKEEGVKAVCVGAGTNSAQCFLIYKTGEKNDTILFIDYLTMYDKIKSFSISAKQLNASGRPEVIIQDSIFIDGRTASGKRTEIEIWNLDSKKQLFDALIYSYSHWEYPSDSGIDDFMCEYSYDFQFTHDSEFVIKNLKSENENYDQCAPDHQEGTYKLVNDEYILIEEK